jgi:purine catabolism regulator
MPSLGCRHKTGVKVWRTFTLTEPCGEKCMGGDGMDHQLRLLQEQIRKVENECGESYLSVKEVLQIETFKGCKVLAGHRGLDLPCKHITILETPEGVEWLQGEEFLLTTGYPFKNNEKMAAELIAKLHERRVAAVGIKENRYLPHMPEEMLEQSERYGLPLIALPYELIYTDTISQFYEKLFYNKNQYLLGLKEMYEKLSSLIYSSTNVQQVIDVLSVLANATIVVFDPAMNVLYLSLNRNQGNCDCKQISAILKKNKISKKYFEIKSADFYINAYPIISETKTIGYVGAISQVPADHLTRNILDYGRIILCLKIVKEENEYLNHIKIKQAITEIIINKTDLSEEFYQNINYAYDWEGIEKFIGICVMLDDRSGKAAKVFRDHFYIMLSRGFKEKGFLITENAAQFFLFCAIDAAEDCAAVAAKIKMFYRHLHMRLKIGISGIRPHIKFIPEMYNESRVAAEFNENDGFCSYDSLDIIKLLYPLKNDRQVHDFYKETIFKIGEYDHKNNGQLLNTLDYFFKYNMNKKMVADRLFIHTETLRYRLNKIEQITGFSLNTAEGLFVLQMSLKLHKLLGLQEKKY